jgi:hypothetical protein
VGDAKAGHKNAAQGAVYRRRAVGTRDKVVSHLSAVTEVTDETGMASTRLAEAVGYPGSSVAFAQLLSGMERDGLIVREVRGKRTYRITLTAQGRRRDKAGAAAPGSRKPRAVSASAAGATAPMAGASGGGASVPGGGQAAEPSTLAVTGAGAGWLPDTLGTGDFDYDELARRLLIQVVRRLAANPGEAEQSRPAARDQASLEETVAGLERELATAWTRHGTLTAENVKLRQQLREAQRNLEIAQRARRLAITDELNRAEAVLLDRLLSPAPDTEGRQSGASA